MLKLANGLKPVYDVEMTAKPDRLYHCLRP